MDSGSTVEWRLSPGPGGESDLRMPGYWHHAARTWLSMTAASESTGAEGMPGRPDGLPRRLPPPAGRW